MLILFSLSNLCPRSLAQCWLLSALVLGACGGRVRDNAAEGSTKGPSDKSQDGVDGEAQVDLIDDPDFPIGGEKCEGMLQEGGPNFLKRIGCWEDFTSLALEETNSQFEGGVLVVQTLIDTEFDDRLYFANHEEYPNHYSFASEHLSVKSGYVDVSSQNAFLDQYDDKDRRFLLGSIHYYQSAKVWTYQIAPYDTASVAMIERAFDRIVRNTYFGSELKFLPSSTDIASVAEALPSDVEVILAFPTTAPGYQPLNLGETYGRLVFATEADLENSFVAACDLVVLEESPQYLPPSAGVIVSSLQTQLGLVKQLSKSRGVPSMAYGDAFNLEDFRRFEGQWVHLTVSTNGYDLEGASESDVEDWWEARLSEKVKIPLADKGLDDLRDIEDVVELQDPEDGDSFLEALDYATRAFGGEAAHLAAATQIEGMPYPDAFVIPMSYYFRFMQDHGLDERVEELLADPLLFEDVARRNALLEDLQREIGAARLDADFEQLLLERLAQFSAGAGGFAFYPSTNADGIDGLAARRDYAFQLSAPEADPESVSQAVRQAWAELWSLRAFSERAFRGLDHSAIGMALLVQASIFDPQSNGVALTNEPFSQKDGDTPFFINVQEGDEPLSIESDDESDRFLYYYEEDLLLFLSHADRLDEEEVLRASEIKALALRLDQLRSFFEPAYGPKGAAPDYWAMEVEFHFQNSSEETPALVIHRVRPFEGD